MVGKKRTFTHICTHLHTHLHTLLRVFSRKKIVGLKAFSQKTEEENSKMTGYFARMFSNFYGYFS